MLKKTIVRFNCQFDPFPHVAFECRSSKIVNIFIYRIFRKCKVIYFAVPPRARSAPPPARRSGSAVPGRGKYQYSLPGARGLHSIIAREVPCIVFRNIPELRCLFCACFVLVLCNCLPGSHPSQGSDRSCISASLATAAVPVIFTPSSPFLPVKMITCGEPLILTLSNRTSTRYSPTAPAVNLMP